MSRFLGHACPNLVLRSAVMRTDGINDKEYQQSYQHQLDERKITHLVQQSGMSVVITVSRIRRITPFDFEGRILRTINFKLSGKIIFIAVNFYSIQVEITGDAVILVGFNDGNGMLFIPYQVWQGDRKSTRPELH